MRVLVHANLYPPHHHGGYELLAKDVVERFRERGHEVGVLTSTVRVPGVADDAGERDAGIRRDLELYWDDHVLLSPPFRRRLAIERHNRGAVLAAIEEFRPDVVSTWNLGATSLGLMTAYLEAAVPIVHAVCDEWPVYAVRLDAWTRMFRHLDRRPLRPLTRSLRRLFGVPVVPPDIGSTGSFLFASELMHEKAVRESRWSFPNWTIVHLGIDERDFPVLDPPLEPRPWNGRILYVGRLDVRKGIETVIRALPLLPDATLDVLGSGDREEARRLDGIVEDLGLASRVAFGVEPRSELAARYAAADVVVFPSIWDEPFGLVPIEAMACATPVVATGAGGSAEFLVDGTNCVLYPAGDHEELAATIRRVAEDPELRRRLVDGGRETARRLTAARMTDHLLAWHQEAVDRSTGVHRPSAGSPSGGTP